MRLGKGVFLPLLYLQPWASDAAACSTDPSSTAGSCFAAVEDEHDTTALLQTKGQLQTKASIDGASLSKTSKEWLWGDKKKPSLPRGPTVYWDGFNEIKTHVKKMPGQFVTSILYSFPGATNGITANTTHVLFPLGARVEARYVKEMHGTDDAEVGVVVARCVEQNSGIPPMMSKDITAGCAEKAHAYWRDKDLDMTAYDRAMNYDKSFFKSDDTEERNEKTTMVNLLASPGPQMMTATGIPHEALKAWSNDGGVVPDSMQKQAAQMKLNLDFTYAKLKDEGANFSDPLLSMVNSLHWDNAAVDKANGKIVFPLSKKMGTYRGQTTSAPFVAFDALQGTSEWTYHAPTDTFHVFFGASVQGHLPDPGSEDGEPGMIYLGAEDGAGDAVAYTGVAPNHSFSNSLLAYGMRGYRDLMYNRDYTYLFKDPAKLCPPSHLNETKTLLDQYFKKQQEHMMKPNDGTVKSELKMLISSTINKVMPCATDFLKPDHLNAAEYNLFMAAAFTHAMLEMPVSLILDVVAARDWNNINTALI